MASLEPLKEKVRSWDRRTGIMTKRFKESKRSHKMKKKGTLKRETVLGFTLRAKDKRG